ncbi:MAG: D-alanyl-D-alanine carboxypeptidase family protein [Cyanobacteria bacterium P01_A01_bin.137]
MANFIDDIPEARRETLVARTEPSVAKSSSGLVPWLLLITAVLGLGGLGIFWWLRPSPPVANAPADSATDSATADAPPPANPETTGAAIASESATVAAASPTDTPVNSEPDTPSLLGHRPYPLADASGLITISTNAMVRLKPEVAQKVETMMTQARAAGIRLDVISGFRSLEDQEYLFFELKAERGQTTQTRAEVSAPPGYSEHHTGYAVDFIDGAQPAADLSPAFENTQAFGWLKENAAYYGFEMSFPKDNDQNVAYEPWHWRYVGNQESLELFYQD